MVAFLFDKKSLAMLAAAALVLSALLFGSGFLLGVQWSLPAAADEMAARQIPIAGASAPAAAPPASTEPAATEPLASEPIAIEPAAPPPPAPPVTPQPTAPSQPAAPASAASVSPATEPAAEPTAPAVAEEEAAVSAPAAPAAIPAAAESPAPPATAPAAPAPETRPATAVAASAAAPGEPAFSLQVGAFARRENCDATVAALASHGYQPYVVDLAGRSRVLHTVRIGRYEDREAAAQALAQFRHKERQPAVILPPGS